MSKPEQVLVIDPPNELKFKGPFQQGNTTYVKLTNPSSDKVFFKIKTTAPKKYCVRPNSGLLDSHEKVEIAITPQPVYFDPNEKNKHKFMVQSVIAPEGKTNIDQVWKDIGPDQLMDSKLKCVFDTPPGAPGSDPADATTQNEVKKKSFTADVKQSSTPMKDNFQHAENLDPAKSKASEQVMQLMEVETKLRHENLMLREEIERLRQQQLAGDGRSVAAGQHMYDPPEKPTALRLPLIAIAIGVGLLGVIIGKFFM